MGRHFEFNRDEALNRAMSVFWQKGYKGTSMKDLVDRMGLQPGSIYNSFGDKRTLFLEAVRKYGDTVTSKMIQVLYSDGPYIDNIEKFFNSLVRTPSEKKSIGCLLSNTVVELAPHDKEVADVVNGFMKRIEEAFSYCLEKAVSANELPEDTDIRSLSFYLATCTHGLIVTGKSASDPDRMRSIVEIIMTKLR